jgi:hypothetical protein
MNRVSVATFRRAIKKQLGVEARIRSVLSVRANNPDGEMLWDGDVVLFDLAGDASMKRCFVWERGGLITIVCEDDEVRTAYDAVMTAIS